MRLGEEVFNAYCTYRHNRLAMLVPTVRFVNQETAWPGPDFPNLCDLGSSWHKIVCVPLRLKHVDSEKIRKQRETALSRRPAPRTTSTLPTLPVIPAPPREERRVFKALTDLT